MSLDENAWTAPGVFHFSVIASARQTGDCRIRVIRGPARERLPNVPRESRFSARSATDGTETGRAAPRIAEKQEFKVKP